MEEEGHQGTLKEGGVIESSTLNDLHTCLIRYYSILAPIYIFKLSIVFLKSTPKNNLGETRELKKKKIPIITQVLYRNIDTIII